MMLHNEFCTVWLSLSDVTGKRTLLINIHIERVQNPGNDQLSIQHCLDLIYVPECVFGHPEAVKFQNMSRAQPLLTWAP